MGAKPSRTAHQRAALTTPGVTNARHRARGEAAKERWRSVQSVSSFTRGLVERVVERRHAVCEEVESRGAREHGARLLAHFRQDEHRSLRLALQRELFERMDAGGVDGGDVAHAQDQDARRLFDLAYHFANLVRRAEEKRSVDFVDLDALRNDAPSQRAVAAEDLRDR